MRESWSYTDNPDGSVTGIVTGRIKKPLCLKLNPIWLLLNSDDPRPPIWYQPKRLNWLRTIMWYARNPFHNLQFYVIGVADRNYSMVTAWVNPAARRQLPKLDQYRVAAVAVCIKREREHHVSPRLAIQRGFCDQALHQQFKSAGDMTEPRVFRRCACAPPSFHLALEFGQAAIVIEDEEADCR